MTNRRPGTLIAAILILALATSQVILSLGQDPSSVVQQPPAETDPDDRERIRVDVNLTSLRFSVQDPQGGFVNHLALDDFRVLEDGVPQELVYFEPPANASGRVSKAWLAFLLDVSGSTFATRAEEIIAAQTFLNNITDQTQTGIFGFTDKLIPFQSFTADRSTALRAFREARRHLGKTAIYDSLKRLIGEIGSKADPNHLRAVILLSDGLDDEYSKAAATAAYARQHNIVIYTILVPSAAQIYIGPSAPSDGSESDAEAELRNRKESAFASLSAGTGGKHFSGFETILDFGDTLAKINDALFGNLYTLGYYSQFPEVPLEERNIDVRLDQRNLTISEPFKKLPQDLAPKKNLIAALFENRKLPGSGSAMPRYREIGAELDVLTARNDGGRIGLPFRIKINPLSFRASQRDGISTQLGVIGVLIDRQGNEAVRLREVFRVQMRAKEIRDGRGIVYSNKLFAPPGQYELRVALLELATWRLTAFERSVRVIAP